MKLKHQHFEYKLTNRCQCIYNIQFVQNKYEKMFTRMNAVSQNLIMLAIIIDKYYIHKKLQKHESILTLIRNATLFTWKMKEDCKFISKQLTVIILIKLIFLMAKNLNTSIFYVGGISIYCTRIFDS